jgi:NADPH-dependent glutamate synthase beta subunit-like oxidoreductase
MSQSKEGALARRPPTSDTLARSMPTEHPRHVIAVIGGATAGAEAAGILAERGVSAVVFEQNARPYGKIEDGLPRWHAKLRRKEFDAINERLARPGVHFVPCTRIGRDVTLQELIDAWGFTAVLLAHGAWRDRPLPIAGADAFVDRGLVYQNSFIYWFNHYTEQDYAGPRYDVVDGTIVVGGGLASIDVVKVLQIELVQRALAARGIDEDVLRLEHAGIPAVLAAHDLAWDDLGLHGATLFYRRRVEDMPLAEAPEDANAARLKKVESTRRRILEKAMQKYCFRVRPQMVPVGLVVEGDRLAGLRFQHTRIEGGRAVPVPGEVEEVRAPLVVSSIGSVPEPMEGVAQEDGLYRYTDPQLGRLEGYDAVFSTGNVVTGKGNIAVSRRHSVQVTEHLLENFLGLDGDHGDEAAPPHPAVAAADAAADGVANWIRGRPALDSAAAERLLARVRERQRAVGFDGDYRTWIARVTPPDLA